MAETGTNIPPGYFRNEDLLETGDYLPKRFGLKFDPCTIVLEYMVRSTGKLHHHKMKLMRLTADSDLDKMYDYLVSRHELYISAKKVGKE